MVFRLAVRLAAFATGDMTVVPALAAWGLLTTSVLVGDGARKLVPEGDVDAAARAIVELSKDPDQAKKLRSAARAEALQRYTPENIANVWFLPFAAIYQQALK